MTLASSTYMYIRFTHFVLAGFIPSYVNGMYVGRTGLLWQRSHNNGWASLPTCSYCTVLTDHWSYTHGRLGV